MSLVVYTPTVAYAQASDCGLDGGDLFKVKGSSAVYYLANDYTRLYFPNSDVYFSWYEDYSNIKEISSECVDAYPQPTSAPYGINYRPGSRLIKVAVSPSVYVIEPDNTLRKISSESVARELYGDDWASLVRDVSDVFWPNFIKRGVDLAEAVPHNGMVVKGSTTGYEYFVKNGLLERLNNQSRVKARMIDQSLLDKLSKGTSPVDIRELFIDPVQHRNRGTVVDYQYGL